MFSSATSSASHRRAGAFAGDLHGQDPDFREREIVFKQESRARSGSSTTNRRMVLSVVSRTVRARMCTSRSARRQVTSWRRPSRLGMKTLNWDHRLLFALTGSFCGGGGRHSWRSIGFRDGAASPVLAEDEGARFPFGMSPTEEPAELAAEVGIPTMRRHLSLRGSNQARAVPRRTVSLPGIPEAPTGRTSG